jgi:membrane-bound metal-dependent hydrolase YbcI (DUF457 family)
VRGRDHAALAAVGCLAADGYVLPYTHTAVGGAGLALAVSTALAFGAGPLNDIDLPGSTVSRCMGFVTIAFYELIRPIAGPHRTRTHSLAGVATFVYAVQLGVDCQGRWAAGHWERAGLVAGRVWLWFLLSVIISSGLAIITVREHSKPLRSLGHWKDLIALTAAGGMVWTGYDLRLAVPAVAIGMLTHLAGDMCTTEALPYLLWPLRFEEGGPVENGVVFPVLVAALLYLIAVRAGAVLPGAHFLEAAR